MYSGILFVLQFIHKTGMDDFHLFDPICDFVHFVVLSVVMSSLVVMSIVMAFVMSSCQLRSGDDRCCDVNHDVICDGGRNVVCDVIMLVVML